MGILRERIALVKIGKAGGSNEAIQGGPVDVEAEIVAANNREVTEAQKNATLGFEVQIVAKLLGMTESERRRFLTEYPGEYDHLV